MSSLRIYRLSTSSSQPRRGRPLTRNDKARNTIFLSYPNGSATNCQNAPSGTGLVTYQYDAANRMTQMSNWLSPTGTTVFGYDHDSNLTGTTFPSATSASVSHTYDNSDALNDTSPA